MMLTDSSPLLPDSQRKETLRMTRSAANLTCVSELSGDWTQETTLRSMKQTLQQISRHLQSARSRLMEQDLPEPQDTISSSTSSVLVAQKTVLRCCDYKKAKHSTDHSISFRSSCSNSSLSHLPVISEGTTWECQSHSKQLQPGDGPQILGSKPLLTSVGTLPPRSLRVNVIQEETTLLKKEPKHILELSIEKRVIGFPEKSIQQHKTQVTNVDLAPSLPYQVKDSIKVTPLALFQVIDSMGMIPESHSESVGLFPQLPSQVVIPMETMKTMSITLKPPNQIIQSMEAAPRLKHQVMESERMATRLLNQVTDNEKATPVALLQLMDSKSHPHTELVGTNPTQQHQAIESVKMNTILNHQVTKPEKMNLRPQRAVMETVEMMPGPQHKVMESVYMTSGSQSQVMVQGKTIPGPICQGTKSSEVISAPLH
ncbi:hypothetical protein P7K49_028761 [Saguinus oedipus]|uniref:Uncharacterized protein n=1 Tax=Saguinus oedipus TaxID=9490 RepID=A0ABQ9U597_SAGOE|nr:hypothetical protein P7K49_028761 [Saguinus oedipus]